MGWYLYNNAGSGFISLTLDSSVFLQGSQSAKVTWTQQPVSTCGIARQSAIRGGFKPNTTYVLSLWAKATGGAVGLVPNTRWNTHPTETWLEQPKLTTSWQRYIVQLAWGASVDTAIYIDSGASATTSTSGAVNFDCFQCTEGLTTTDYSPSPWETADAAATAQTAATNAQTAANSAITTLNNMASDSVLTKQEKPAAIQKWTDICNEKLSIDVVADNYGLSHTAFDNAYSSLATYLGSLSPAWNDTTQDTSVNATNWSNTWTAYYNEKQSILDAAADNWNFEASTTLPPPGWVANGTVTLSYETTSPQSGTQSLKVVTGQQYAGAISTRVWKVIPGEKYKISGYAKAASGTTAAIQLAYLDVNGAYIDSVQGFTTSTSWTYLWTTAGGSTSPFTVVPSNAVSARLAVGCWNAGGGTAWFDQIRVTRVTGNGELALDTSTGLNGQGSINPLAVTCSGSLTGILNGSTPTVQFAFTAGTIYMPDGSSYSVTATTPQNFTTWNGPTVGYSTTYNGNIVYKVSTGSVVIQQFSGSATTYTKSQAFLDGYIAINYGINCTTPTSGGTGGGGGGGGGCFSGNTHVNTPDGSMSFAEMERLEGEVTISNKFGDFRATLLVHDEADWEMVDMGDGELVTLNHMMWDSERISGVAAEEMFANCPRVKYHGKVYNLAVHGTRPWEHWYVLRNGHIASNQKIGP